MTTIGVPPRSPGDWDVPAVQVADEHMALKAQAAREAAALAAELEETRQRLLAAGLAAEAHAWLDADPDTDWPLPGVAHPKTTGSQ